MDFLSVETTLKFIQQGIAYDELSDEEKARLDAAAREQYQREQVNKLREAEQKTAQQEQKRVEKLKEKQQKQAAQYVQPSLFDV